MSAIVYTPKLGLIFSFINSHEHFQCSQPFHHFMLQSCQLSHNSHKTRILALHAHLLLNPHFLTIPHKHIPRFIMSRVSRPE